jgi:hypothetical protein
VTRSRIHRHVVADGDDERVGRWGLLDPDPLHFGEVGVVGGAWDP